MPPAAVTDPADPRLDPFRDLRETERRFLHPPPRGVRQTPCFVAEGARVVARALDAGYAPLAVAIDRARADALGWASAPGLPAVTADIAVLRAATGLGVIREAIGIFARPAEPDAARVLSGRRRILILEGVANPANLGAIVRSAAALGVDATLCDASCADPLYRRAVRGSMGAVLTHPWARVAALPGGLDIVRDGGFAVLAMVTDPDARPLASAIASAGPRVALLLGAEGHGISPAGRAGSDELVTVPMAPGADSLNVGAAAAVACYLLGRVS